MLNKNLALVFLVVFSAGCGLEVRSYVMTKPRVGLDVTGNGGCVVGKCAPAPAPTETTRKVYVLEITRPVPESEVQKIEETAINTIVQSPPDASASSNAPANNTPPASDNSPSPAPAPQPVVPVVGELPGTISPTENTSASAASQPSQDHVQGGTTYTVQKDDTLQKISKKVYGTYAKWYKIYKANKEKIKNPNVLRPGIVLDIPAVK